MGRVSKLIKRCFIRDMGFFLSTWVALSLILIVGKISFWGAIMFVFIYVVYAFVVMANEILRKHAKTFKLNVVTPLLLVAGSFFSVSNEEDESVYRSTIHYDLNNCVPGLHGSSLQWMWASNVAICLNCGHKGGPANISNPLWGWNEDELDIVFSCSKLFLMFKVPLSLPRRLTILVVEEERWSKKYAVASAALAPLLVAFLWNSGELEGSKVTLAAYVLGGVAGMALGASAFVFSCHDFPPQRFLFPWVLGGFVMSIVWFYIVANELLLFSWIWV